MTSPWWDTSGRLFVDGDGILHLRREDADGAVTHYKLGRLAEGSTSHEIAHADEADYRRLRARWLDAEAYGRECRASDLDSYAMAKGH